VVVRNLVLTRDHVTLGGAPVDMKKLTTSPPPLAKPAAVQDSKTVAKVTPAPAKIPTKSAATPSKKPWISPLNPDSPKASTPKASPPKAPATPKKTKPVPLKEIQLAPEPVPPRP